MIPLILERVILSANSPQLQHVLHTLEATISNSKVSNSKEAAGMIRYMEIPDDDINSDTLARFLPFTSKLSSLVYGYVIQEERYSIDIIDAQALGRLLAPVRHSLTHLKITYYPGTNETSSGGYPYVKGYCCLKDMAALQRLEVCFCVLLGTSPRTAPKLADVLPPNIVQLRIMPDPWERDPSQWKPECKFRVFEKFVSGRNWEQFTPRLKALNFHIDEHRYGWSKEKIAAKETVLIGLCRENDLE